MITETRNNVIPNERNSAHIPRVPQADSFPMRQTLSRFAPDTFTMLLVATVMLASFAPPSAAFELPVKIATDVAIAFMFFLYGARLATSNVIAGLAHWRLHALVLASTFVMFPLVGLLLFHCLPQWLVPGPLALGMLYLCLLPSTIQSSLAFTSIAGGNVPAAMCSATLSSLVGTVATPLFVGIFASARGGAPTGDAITEIGLLLVAPLLAGQVLRPWIGEFVLRHKAILSATDRGSILLVVYGAFGHAVSAGLWHVLPISGFAIMVVIEAMVLAFMLFATHFAAMTLGFNREDTIAIVFCGSKKSLAAGVPMAGVLFPGPDLGMILLPTMLFHQMQLMVCAVLARRWAQDVKAEAEAPPQAVAPPLGAMAPAR
jgi:solute carrier family 10 (sodium/bile acid cotransporter), member 7